MTCITKYSILILLIFILLFSFGCNTRPIITLDEYNPPYNVVAIPGDNGTSINVRFISGVTATDFAGFNIYVDDLTLFDAAVLNASGGRPTIPSSNHTRQQFEFPVPVVFASGTLHEIAVTAYGTNTLAENGYIETRISPKSMSKCVPRPVTIGANYAWGTYSIGGINVTFTAAPPVSISSPGGIQFFGTQTNFNAVTVVTNANFPILSQEAAANGLYILKDTASPANIYLKIWITSVTSTGVVVNWATNNQVVLWNGV